MGRTYGGVLGLVAFMTVLARNMIDGDTAVGTMRMATICLFAFAVLGFVAGQIADMVVHDLVRVRFEEEMRSRQQEANADKETPAASPSER